jgi:pilus assembly protein CpaE
MTMRSPVLCADSESLLHPELIGLEGEMLQAQTWLTSFSDAQMARSYARSSADSLEIWVAGSDQMEAINLAAAMKRDRDDADVCLLSFAGGGSMLSRAHAAGIDEVLDRSAFLNRYRLSKRAHELARSVGASLPEADGGTMHCNDATPRAFSPKHAGPSAPLHASAIAWRGDARASENRAEWSAAPRALSDAVPVVGRGAVPVQVDDSKPAMAATKAAQASTASGYVLTVMGGGGGTGKSTVATLCACCAQASGRRTAIVDADLQMGDIAYLLGCESPLRIDDLIEAPLRIESLKGGGRLPAVIAVPKRMERSELAAEQMAVVIGALRHRFDVVVVNTGSTWGDMHVQLIEASTNVLFVVDQRPSSIRACKHALDLCSRCGIASKPFLYAVNRCSRKALFSSIDVSCALQGVHVHELQDGGKAVEELLGSGQPLDLLDVGNPLVKSIGCLLDGILPQVPNEDRGFVMPQKRRRLNIRRGRRP